MEPKLAQRIAECKLLPTLPAVALSVLELVKTEAAASKIGKVIENDPALAARLLKTVNSSFYRRSQTVSTISHALVVLGMSAVKTLVLGFSLVDALRKQKAPRFDHTSYWRRAVLTASAARDLAHMFHVMQVEECFLAALLGDIGVLAMHDVIGERYAKMFARAADHAELAASEERDFGMTHAQASAQLASRWRLPPMLAVPIGNHERPEGAPDAFLGRMARVVQLSGQCADVLMSPRPMDALAAFRAALASAKAEIGEELSADVHEAEALMNRMAEHARETAPLFDVQIDGFLDTVGLMQRANEALVSLNLEGQRLAEALQGENNELRSRASIDALTRLANRAHFEKALKSMFWQQRNRREAMSLLMIDIDGFKSINDEHGHPGGDAVLSEIAARVLAALLPGQVAARYGGDELAVLLPGVQRRTAAQIAETIRKSVAEQPVEASGQRIQPTISVGLACLDNRTATPGELLKLADDALYGAKKAGRNRVHDGIGASSRNVA